MHAIQKHSSLIITQQMKLATIIPQSQSLYTPSHQNIQSNYYTTVSSINHNKTPTLSNNIKPILAFNNCYVSHFHQYKHHHHNQQQQQLLQQIPHARSFFSWLRRDREPFDAASHLFITTLDHCNKNMDNFHKNCALPDTAFSHLSLMMAHIWLIKIRLESELSNTVTNVVSPKNDSSNTTTNTINTSIQTTKLDRQKAERIMYFLFERMWQHSELTVVDYLRKAGAYPYYSSKKFEHLQQVLTGACSAYDRALTSMDMGLGHDAFSGALWRNMYNAPQDNLVSSATTSSPTTAAAAAATTVISTNDTPNVVSATNNDKSLNHNNIDLRYIAQMKDYLLACRDRMSVITIDELIHAKSPTANTSTNTTTAAATTATTATTTNANAVTSSRRSLFADVPNSAPALHTPAPNINQHKAPVFTANNVSKK